MLDPALQNRAAGAIMGAFIGDALGLGPHWYYDLAVLRRDYGDWITTYTDPKPGRYHSDLKAGQLSQTGIILRLMLHSLVDTGNSMVVIEHNLDVIKNADWLIDMGPEGGAGGGTVVAAGTPEDIAAHPASFTGRYLKPLLAA